MGRSAPNAWQSAALPIAAVAVLTLSLRSATARADQPQDYMLTFQPDGGWLMIDYFGTGSQITLEHRQQIYGTANDLTVPLTVRSFAVP